MAAEGEIGPGLVSRLRVDGGVSLGSDGGSDGEAYVPAMVVLELSQVGWAARGDSGEGMMLVRGVAAMRAARWVRVMRTRCPKDRMLTDGFVGVS